MLLYDEGITEYISALTTLEQKKLPINKTTSNNSSDYEVVISLFTDKVTGEMMRHYLKCLTELGPADVTQWLSINP